ncbi:hypothetical protein KP509_07G011300 [Ceratopteris richardii]|uniref:Uncharacterized protein n=1 Tax=Ceratopteris richardii TaxID=49495 RepID=A0A8T2UF80_CERRI|nr:hypothetical protein KP509_07G011300 [Ceratopteris richardii]
MEATEAIQYDSTRNSPNSPFNMMMVSGPRKWSQSSQRFSNSSSPGILTTPSSSPNSPSNTRISGPRKRSHNPQRFSYSGRQGSLSAPSSPPVKHRPSDADPQKRMSASLVENYGLSRRNSMTSGIRRCDDDLALRAKIEEDLAQKWAYTLGAELAHHVVGVFADPTSSAYNKRWNSDTATRVFGANPWGYLAKQKFFIPPFHCPEVVRSMPWSMKDIHSAIKVVANIVSTRNVQWLIK